MHAARQDNNGFTLIELVIYVGLFAAAAVIIVGIFLAAFRAFLVIRGEQAAMNNASLALRAVMLEARHADPVYTPTSAFGVSDGRLSFRSTRLVPADHEFSYVDIYLDNGVLYLRRDDGSPEIAITSADVAISEFLIERFTEGDAEGLRVTITAEPVSVSGFARVARTVHSFIGIRPFTTP